MDSERASILRRKAIGKSLLPSVRDFLRPAFGEDADRLDFASLEESDAIWATFESRWNEVSLGKGRGSETFARETKERAAALECVRAVKEQLPCQLEVYLFLPQWPYCGALSLPVGKALAAANDLIRVDQEDMLLCNRTSSVGVVLESFSFESETRYRFLAWDHEYS